MTRNQPLGRFGIKGTFDSVLAISIGAKEYYVSAMMAMGENGSERYRWLRVRDPVAIARLGFSIADFSISGHLASGNS